MNSLFQAALEMQKIMEFNKWPFCFIGGLAVLRWGEIRITQDIDLCILCGFGKEKKFIKELTNKYKSRINDPLSFALANRVLLLYASNDVPIDISLSGLPFEEDMIRRSTPFLFHPNCSLITCSAEDLIVLKSFADRSKDWSDVEGIVMRNGSVLNIDYIIEQLKPLCEIKESPEIVDKLKNIFNQNK